MTLEEYNNLANANLKATDYAWKEIHSAYMACNHDKQTFCKLIQNNKKSLLELIAPALLGLKDESKMYQLGINIFKHDGTGIDITFGNKDTQHLFNINEFKTIKHLVFTNNKNLYVSYDELERYVDSGVFTVWACMDVTSTGDFEEIYSKNYII